VDAVEPLKENSRIIVERHLHHFFENDQLHKRVVRHWIPISGSLFQVEISEQPKLSFFGRLEKETKVVCLY
jgi:hypothetical protein